MACGPFLKAYNLSFIEISDSFVPRPGVDKLKSRCQRQTVSFDSSVPNGTIAGGPDNVTSNFTDVCFPYYVSIFPYSSV